MRRLFVIFICLLLTLEVTADPFFNRLWVFPGFVKHQKLLSEGGQYIFNTKVWQGEVPDGVPDISLTKVANDQMFYIENGKIFLVDSKGIVSAAHYDDVTFQDDGFSRININDLLITIIYGSFLFATPRRPDWNDSENYDQQVIRAYEAQKKIWNSLAHNLKSPMSLHRKTFLYQPIKDMVVPSSLRETIRGEEVVYGTDFYKYRWVYEEGHVYPQMDYLDGVPPWVEAEPGNGTGLEFEVLFSESVDNIVFLNGFVDMQRKHLYKQNARMQTIQIEGDGFTREFTFIDQVRFQEIEFPKQTEKIKVKVVSVYPGSKYEDMAISGMYVRTEPEGISEEEKQRRYREHIEMIKEMYQKQKW